MKLVEIMAGFASLVAGIFALLGLGVFITMFLSWEFREALVMLTVRSIIGCAAFGAVAWHLDKELKK